MSSAKPEAKMSVEQQVKAGLRAVRDFLAGRSGEAKAAPTDDKATRDVVATELLAKMAGQPGGEVAYASEDAPTGELQEISQQVTSVVRDETEREQERARKLFLEHGYFDEAVQALRSASSPGERVSAARALGLVRSQLGTAHLIAAMWDDDPEVRSAAEAAISQINDSTVAKRAAQSALTPSVKETEEADPPQAITPLTLDPENNSDLLEASIATTPDLDRADFSPVADDPVIESEPTGKGTAPATAVLPDEEEQLLLEEHRLKESAEQLVGQLLETVSARKHAEHEVQTRTHREAELRAEALARRNEEEELRKHAHEEAERRRIEERKALTAEQVARGRAETDAQRLGEEETRLRLQAVELRLASAELARQRAASENARKEAQENARRTEARRARDEAKLRHDEELARLESEEEALRATADQIALRRAELEVAREKADAESQRLVEAQERMRASAEAAVTAEAERLQLESEINRRMETALRLLDEARLRGQEEQERLHEEARHHAEEQQHRLAELELMKARAESESEQLAEKEQQILSQVNSLRNADSDTRRRILEAEGRRRAAEEGYRLAAEKAQRVEAEAHASSKSEQQMLAKLESERRAVAVEAQSRAAQEKRIREEIEMFRRLEEQERPRLEAAILQRAQAEARLQELRERLRTEEEIRVAAEREMNESALYKVVGVGQQTTAGWSTHAPENRAAPFDGTGSAIVRPFTTHETPAPSPQEIRDDDLDVAATTNVVPSIYAYLNSIDPYKRAAAVAELARSGSPDAFKLIADCFDDPSTHVRNAAGRAFRRLEPDRTVDLFNRALEEAPDERRRNIGAAIAASGLADEAISNLVSESREETYNALSILFVMAKTGEVEPLIRALEEHPDDEIGKAVSRLLTLSGRAEAAGG